MIGQLERKNAIDTMGEAFGWLRRNPVLILAFLVVGAVEALGDEVLLIGLVGVLLTVFVDGVTHRFALAEAAGDRTSFVDEVGPVLDRYVSLLGAFVVYVFAVAVGLLLLIVPGIYVGVRLSLAFPAIVIDDQRAFDGLRTSWDVAHGNLLKLLGISVFAILVALSTIIAAGVVTVALDSLALLIAVSALVTAILSPIVELSYARVYLENREEGDQPGDDGDDGWNVDDANRDAHW